MYKTFVRQHNVKFVNIFHIMHEVFKWRRRAHGTQGRPCFSPELRHQLFQWFIDMRKEVKGRLWPRTVRSVAEKLKDVLRKEAVASLKPPPLLPVISSDWLKDWKQEFGVSFKKPNRKYKVSRQKCLDRTRVTTLNVYRVRLAFKLLFGQEIWWAVGDGWWVAVVSQWRMVGWVAAVRRGVRRACRTNPSCSRATKRECSTTKPKAKCLEHLRSQETMQWI